MPEGNAQLNARDARKQLLIVESELNRQLLREDGRVFVDKIRGMAERTADLRELMAMGISVASAFRSRNDGAASGRRTWLHSIANSVRFGTQLWSAFRNRKSRQ